MKKRYDVNCIQSNNLILTGKGDGLFWDHANGLTDFSSPWDSKKMNKIAFKALWDRDNMFFCFIVDDPEVHIDCTNDSKASINNSDRVEIFFKQDDNLNPYYCLEIDPSSRIMDFKAYPNKQFDFNWNWPVADIEVKSSINERGFIVEGRISIESLKKFGLIKDGALEVGLYRAKYHKQNNGSFEPTWITWVDPGTEIPNFHIVSSFGSFKLENY